jgi:superfamily II DNA or RNA helicase
MIRIAHNATTAKLFDADRDAKLEVHRLLSYRVEGSEHMAAFKSGGWNGRASFFDFAKGTFPTGFVRLVAQGLRKKGYDIQIVAKPRPEPLGPERPVVDPFGYTERYDYQPAAVDQLVRHGNITVQVATGGGKSRIARMAYKRIDRPTLFLTTRGVLLHQMKEAVEGMGEEVAVLGDGDWGIPYTRPDGKQGRRITKFVVGMVQTLAQRLEIISVDGELEALTARRDAAESKAVAKLKEDLKQQGITDSEVVRTRCIALLEGITSKYPSKEQDRAEITAKVARHERLRLATIEILARFELVIAEEAHEVSGNSFYAVMSACRNAHYRMALTATPFMKDDEEANMKLLACCGPVAIRITEKMLIDRGILARPYFKFLKLDPSKKPKGIFRTTGWPRAYELGIVKNEYRNKLFCVEMLRGIKYGLNGMILVTHKAHGKIFLDMLRKAGARAEFIWGEDDQAGRKAALRRLGNGEIDVLIGTSIMDVGVDVPSLGIVALAGGGKAEVATRQRIGRGLREKKGKLPNVAFIVDAADSDNTHLARHARERRAIIEGTPGFAEGIVDDFDYVGLGLERLAA